MRERLPCVYIMASDRFGTLYVGVTSDLLVRVAQHRAGTFGGFSKKYGVDRLVWFEMHETMDTAIAREKSLKAMATGLEMQPDRAAKSGVE